MRSCKTLFSAGLIAAALFIGSAAALEKERFSMERFQELQAGGELVVVDIYADWCGTCAKQQEILADYREEHPDVDLHILEVDFDKDDEWVRHFRAPRQSTILVYAGEEQYSYTVAETDRDRLFAEINQAAEAL